MKKTFIILCFFSLALPAIAGDFVIGETFRPGIGEPVGRIVMSTGEVLIFHDREQTAYRAGQNIPLYRHDTVVVRQGRVSLKMEDGSILSLAGDTRLRIDKCVYDPERKDRLTFLKMAAGKARFWVRKLAGFNRRDFKVKTKTAIVGVRGSDFVVESSEHSTTVSTMENTRLEVTNMSTMERRELSDYQKITVEKEVGPEVEKLTPEEIEKLRREFPPVVDTAGQATEEALRFGKDEIERVDGRLPVEAREIEKEGFTEIEDQIIDGITEPETELPSYPGMEE